MKKIMGLEIFTLPHFLLIDITFFFFSNLVSCLQIVLYLRMCLAHSAGATPVSKSLADMQDDAPAI